MFTALIVVAVLFLAGRSFADDQNNPALHKIDQSQQATPDGRKPENAVTAGEKSGRIWEYDYCAAYYYFGIPSGYLEDMVGQRFKAHSKHPRDGKDLPLRAGLSRNVRPHRVRLSR